MKGVQLVHLGYIGAVVAMVTLRNSYSCTLESCGMWSVANCYCVSWFVGSLLIHVHIHAHVHVCECVCECVCVCLAGGGEGFLVSSSLY